MCDLTHVDKSIVGLCLCVVASPPLHSNFLGLFVLPKIEGMALERQQRENWPGFIEFLGSKLEIGFGKSVQIV